MKKLCIVFLGALLTTSVFAGGSSQKNALYGLHSKVEVTRDQNNVPTIRGKKTRDVLFVTGYIQAQDRFFQMDVLRKNARGQLAELFGPDLLSSDIESRVVGIERSAQSSLSKETPETLDLLQAYSDGVNTYLQENGLPQQYQAIGLTKEQIKPWEPLDSVSILFSVGYLLNFSLSDIDFTGVQADFNSMLPDEFDAQALFSEDMIRVAPLTNEVVIPTFCENGVCGAGGYNVAQQSGHMSSQDYSANVKMGAAIASFPPLIASTAYNQDYLRSAANLKQYTEKVRQFTMWDIGSNSWSIAKKLTKSRNALSANDPHLSLTSPATLYQMHHVIIGGKDKANVRGVAFPGSPFVTIFCNDNLCFSNTNTNGYDYTDVFQEQAVPCDTSPAQLCVLNAGNEIPLTPVVQEYKVNSFSELGVVDSGILPTDLGGTVLLLPHRSDGAIIDLDVNTGRALSYQYIGTKANPFVSPFLELYKAKSVYDVKDVVAKFFEFGQNYNVADTKGNIGLFNSGVIPVRKDLQNGAVVGAPPYLIRDGVSGEHDWVPAQTNSAKDYEFLGIDERPNVINPDVGFIVQANNDPVGMITDNDPFNQFRQNGGIYYLGSYGAANGARASRITSEIQGLLDNGKKLTLRHMKKIQSNNQSIEAELLTPVLLASFKNAKHAHDLPELKALSQDPQIRDAMTYLKRWNYSTPTGIKEGYDPNDDPFNLPEPSEREKRHSVAATLYSVWQTKLIDRVISKTLDDLGVTPWRLDATKVVNNFFENYDSNATLATCRDVRGKNGVGASGVNFFKTGLATEPHCQHARDYVVLLSLKEALDSLAGDDFALTFKNSTDISTYHWGLLHRVVNTDDSGFFTAPPAGIVSDLSPELPGASKAGGRGTVDVSPNSVGADSDNDFIVDFGPNWRRVSELKRSGNHRYFDIINLGSSGDVSSAFFSDQFPLWLTNRYVKRSMNKPQGTKTTFVPKLKK